MAENDKALLVLDLPKIKRLLSMAYSLVPDDPVLHAAWLEEEDDPKGVRAGKGFWTAGYKKLKCEYDETVNLYIYHRRLADSRCSKAAAEVEAKAKNTDLRKMVMMAEVTMESFTDKYFNLLHKGVIRGSQEA